MATQYSPPRTEQPTSGRTLFLYGFASGLPGNGSDTLILVMDGLDVSSGFGSSVSFGGLLAEDVVKGFERLIMGRSCNSRHTQSLKALLEDLKSLAGDDGLTVRISGRAGARVNTEALAAAGWNPRKFDDGIRWTSPDKRPLTIVIQNDA